MRISVSPPKKLGPPEGPQKPETPETKPRIKEDFQDQADIYNASRSVGNKVNEALTGVVGHVTGNVGLLLPTVGETYKNLWKAETIGPYAKTVGSIVALAGIPMVAAGAMLAGPFQGVAEAFDDNEGERHPLVGDTNGAVADRITSKEDGPDTLLGKAIGNMREFGDKKLEPGEEPWDIPIGKLVKGAWTGIEFLMVKVPAKALELGKKAGIAAKDGAIAAGKAAKKGAIAAKDFSKEYGPKLAGATAAGVTSTIIAGPAGLAIGVGISMVKVAKSVGEIVTGEGGLKKLPLRIGGALLSPLKYIAVGPVMAGYTVKENFTRSFSEGWNGEPVEAIKTTTKAVIENAKEALRGSEDKDK